MKKLLIYVILISGLIFPHINYNYTQKIYNSAEEFSKEFFGSTDKASELSWCKTEICQVPLGASVYLLSDEQFVFMGWFNNDNNDNQFLAGNGKNYKNKGQKNRIFC